MLWPIYPLDVVRPLWPPIGPYFTGYSISKRAVCLESVSVALNNRMHYREVEDKRRPRQDLGRKNALVTLSKIIILEIKHIPH